MFYYQYNLKARRRRIYPFGKRDKWTPYTIRLNVKDIIFTAAGEGYEMSTEYANRMKASLPVRFVTRYHEWQVEPMTPEDYEKRY